ncbi:MAG: hypothetical protein ACI8X5_000839 [Planctomycetota bacterium]|jgi:hypothetical protein
MTTETTDLLEWLHVALESRLKPSALDWYEKICAEIHSGVNETRFAALISMASRHSRRIPMEASSEELSSARSVHSGWNPERWSVLDLMRVGFVLSRSDLEEDSAPLAICGVAKYADVGELCALYRSMIFLPRSSDYLWQAGEGCRSNMNEVFESIACDNPYPAREFDNVGWSSLAVKAIFTGAPLWRVWGLDSRHNPELAHIVLDLAEERRSAGRAVQPELWLCLGTFGGERAIESMVLEMSAEEESGRRGAAFGLARAGRLDLLTDLRERETSPIVQGSMDRALAGHHSQLEFIPLHPER